MSHLNSIAVFCGSSSGEHEIFQTQATLLGQALARKNIRLIYGGANVGLMGAVADGTLKAGGQVVGVLPKFLKEKEIAHKHLSELILVDSMHERKIKMNELCDGVIALPGGYGTLEEFFEMLTWAQLGLHKKPLAILNINGFYDSLDMLIRTMVDNGFLKAWHMDMLFISDSIEAILNSMPNYKVPEDEKWAAKKIA